MILHVCLASNFDEHNYRVLLCLALGRNLIVKLWTSEMLCIGFGLKMLLVLSEVGILVSGLEKISVIIVPKFSTNRTLD